MNATFFDRLILRLAEPAAVVGLFESRWSLEVRVKRILEPGRVIMTRSQRGAVLSAMALLATAAVALAAVRPGPVTAVALKTEADEAVEMIRGQVVDEAGKPVTGATVSGAARGGVKTKVVQSGADGRFALPVEGPWDGRDMVRASFEGGERLGIRSSTPARFYREAPVTVVLKPSRHLAVRVLDTAGKPVVDAAVEVATDQGSGAIDPGITDASGIARFRLPVDLGITGVLALKNGVGAGLYQNSDATPVFEYKPMPAEVSVSLQPARTLSVRALDPEGQPLPGIRIGWTPLSISSAGSIHPVGLITESTTDAAGIARFPWFPKQGGGSFRVLDSRELQAATPLENFVRPNDSDLTLTVRFERKATLAGRVVNGDGSPARGVVVVANGQGRPLSNPTSSRVRTGEDGSYRLSVQPGHSYAIGAIDPDWTAQPLMGILTREGERRDGLDLRLIRGTRLHGRVATHSGDGTYISIRQLGPELPPELQRSPAAKERQGFWYWTKLDAQGRYEARLGPGDYEIRVADRAHLIDGALEKEMRHVDGTGEIVCDFLKKPSPPPISLSGLVVGAAPGGAERPVKASINLIHVGGGAFRTTTDDAGRFSLMRPDREATLYARSTDGVAALKVAKGAKEVKVVLAPGGTVTGRLVDGQGRPLAGDGPSITMQSGPDNLPPTNALQVAKLEADGRYQFKGLIPGAEYLLTYVQGRGNPRNEVYEIKRFRVNGADKIDLGDFNVPNPPAAPKKP
jgi:hypothetical protein